MLLEEFAEEGLVREIKFICYLLDSHIGVFQQVFRILYGELVYPFGYRISADSAYGSGQIPRCQVHLVCIPSYLSVLQIIAAQQGQEAVEMFLFPLHGTQFILYVRHVGIKDVG